MKRSDITTATVLASVAERNRCQALYDRHPAKIVDAALEREIQGGLIECGVSLRTAWLTTLGQVARKQIDDEAARRA